MSSGKVKCTCGWSWNKSDSSKKDMYICHECGRDNSNNIPKAQDGDELLPIPYSNEYLDSLENDYLKMYNDPNREMDDGYDRFYHSLIDHLPDVTRKTKGWLKYIPGEEEDGTFVEEDAENTTAPLPSKKRMVKRVEDYEISDKPDTSKQVRIAKYMQQRAINKLDKRSVSNNKVYDIDTPKQKNGGWLNKYADGGTMQEHQENYNNSQASAPEGMVGDGFSNVGRNYSPAWGGQFQMGGNVYPVNYVPQAQMGMSMPGAPGHMYARVGAPSKGPKRNQVDVTDASAQGGKKLNPFTYPKSDYQYSTNPFLVRDPQYGIFIGGVNPTYSTDDFSIGASMVGVGNEHFQKLPADYGIRGSYNPTDSLSINANISKDNIGAGLSYRFQNGGEMRYYQNGLDWKPKGMKDGGWLDGYEKAQDGDLLDKWRADHPTVRSFINDTQNRKIQAYKGKGKETNIIQKDNVKTVTPKIGKIATAKGKEQRAIEQNKLAQQQSEQQAAKDWVQGSMEEAYKSPLMSPGYFTPEGVAIGALQGATKLGPDLYEGNYKGAAIDVLMSLPIGIPAAKGLGRLLGPEEGLMGKVSQEVNINRNLSNIKKEGQLQGLSDYEIAKKQMEQVGITSNQRKAYTPVVSEFAEKYIKPRNYTGTELSGQNKFQEIIQNIKQGGYKEPFPERADAWKLYLGRPQVNKTFNLADTAPALHRSYKPGSLEGMDIYNIKSKSVTENIGYTDGYAADTSNHLKILENPMGFDRDPAIMGGYNKILTKEGTQYNDIWDLDVPVSYKSLFPNKISENPMFENIFYKTSPNGVQSPRGFKLPVEKFVGKPFMSHGNLPYTSMNHVDKIKESILLHIKDFEPMVNTAYKGPERLAKLYADLKNLENYPKYKEGGVIKDDRGQWAYPGEITRISGGKITMKKDPKTGKALTEPLLGIADTGEQQWMYPGEDYNFEGANYVTEIPKRKLAKNGLRQEQKSLQNLDNLLNFTNYNKPQPGGWLNKYN